MNAEFSVMLYETDLVQTFLAKHDLPEAVGPEEELFDQLVVEPVLERLKECLVQYKDHPRAISSWS